MDNVQRTRIGGWMSFITDICLALLIVIVPGLAATSFERAELFKHGVLIGLVGIALVTTHIPLRQVAKFITADKIIETTNRVHQYLRNFITRPKIAVCGLNPHASDHGLFGDEENKIIAPAIRKLNRRGVQAEGPFSADSLFYRAAQYDAIICLYHDQGLIPLKMRHFFDAVNITLGLPFLRTSVDHGTAFDIAGKAEASSISYGQALEHAFRWVKRTRGKTPWANDSHSRRARAQS
jgi:4-hydroxythreonine-4-phosphate dehydrogenase